MNNAPLSFFFPVRCAFCGKLLERGEQDICFSCRDAAILMDGEVCPYCSKDVLACKCTNEKNLDRLVVAFLYEGSVQRGIQRFKFHDCPEIASVLGRFLYERGRETFPNRFDFVATVPMFPKKQQKRGYNQAELLAEAYHIPFADQALKKIKKHVPLHHLTSKERQIQIKDTFSPGKDIAEIKGSHILLVDDVYTTGATLKECACILRKSGVCKVSGIVLAATEFHAVS